MPSKTYRNLAWKNHRLMLAIFVLTAIMIAGAIYTHEKFTNTFNIFLIGFGVFISLITLGSWFAGVIITDEGITSFSPFQKNKFMAWQDIKAIKCISVNQYFTKEIPFDKLKTSWLWGTTFLYLLYEDFEVDGPRSLAKRKGIATLYRKEVFDEVVLHMNHYFTTKN